MLFIKIIKYFLSIFFIIFSVSTNIEASLIADYHFNSCSWDGTSGEIKDNTDNYNATAKNGTFPDKGIVDLSANLITDNYIKLENNIPISENYTISVWIKFPLNFYKHTDYSDTYFFNIADRPSSDYDFIYLRYNADDGWKWKVQDDDGNDGNTFPSLSDGWHLLTFTANNGTTTLYIDSTEENSISKHSKGELSIIGTSDYDDDLDGQTIGALIDEFKVYDTALSDEDIQSIYYNEKIHKNYDGSDRTTVTCSISSIPKAEYRFDSCSWSESADEVDENINNYNGIAYNTQPTSEAILFNSANLSADSITDYISVKNSALNGLNAFTISTWIKTSTGNYQTILSGANSSEDNEALLWLRDSGKIEFWIKGIRSDSIKIPNIQDNNWHHIIWSREDKHVILYIDGNKELDAYYSDDTTNGDLSIDENGLVIGQDQDSVGGDLNQTFLGNIDELKIFDKVLTESEIQIIYKNDQLGINYDGNTRDIPLCNLVADYHFDSCEWDTTAREVMDQTDKHDGSLTSNEVNITVGKINNSASFPDENNTEYINTIDTGITPMDIGAQGSISFWYKNNVNWNDDDKNKTIISANNADTEKYFFISLLEGGKLMFCLEDEADQDFISKTIETFSFTSDEWVHISVSWDLSHNYSLYINGVKKEIYVRKDTIASTNFADLNTIHIGDALTDYGNNGKNSANGLVDEFKIFDTILPAKQIETIYNNENSGKNYDGSTREDVDCSLSAPIVNYYIDKCLMGDTVADMSGNDLNLTVVNGVLSTDGKINNSADLNGSNYLDGGDILNDVFGTSSNQFTITAWIKPKNLTDEKTNHNTKNVFLAKASDGDNDNIEIGVDPDGALCVYIDTQHVDGDKANKYKAITIGSGITTGTWYFISIRYYNDTIKVSIDENITANTTALEGGGNLDKAVGSEFTIGSSQHEDTYFDGQIDEVKVFNKVLTNAQILEIYNNELSHKNYDSSHRMTVDCTTPILLAEYRFDECKYDGSSDEVIDTKGGDNSGTIDDFNSSSIQTVSDEIKIGRSLKIDEKTININNLTISTEIYKKNSVLFWMYWDGTTYKMPFGWTKYDLWFTSNDFGFNAGDSLMYGINNDGLENGWHHVAAIFTNGDIESNRLYIDGVLQTIEQKSGTITNSNAYATSSASISGWRNNSGYRFIGYLDELKIYKGEVNATTISDIYNNESSLVRDIICSQAIFNAVNQNGGCFNWDNNITTKIAGSPIKLTILSADKSDDNTSLQDANITKLELLSFSDSSCSTLYETTEVWSGNEEVNDSACFNPPSFTHDKAIKCAKIKITGIYDGVDIEANSSDTFSVKPDKFILDNLPSTKLISEHDYTFNAKAVNSDGTTASTDYNTSITPKNIKYFRDGSDGSSMDGSFLPTDDFTFSDGSSADTTLSFNNVGIIALELNDTTWAEVDNDDTPLANRTIYLKQNLTFIPDHFKIEFLSTPTMNNHYVDKFTYLSNNLNMKAKLENLDIKITAEGEKNSIMTNYQNPENKWFENSIKITPTIDIPNNPNTVNIPTTLTNQDINFSSGVATHNIDTINFNYDRNYSNPINPFTIKGSDTNISITVEDETDNNVTGTITKNFDKNATFYYGRVITKDIKTNKTPTKGEVLFAIYSTSTLNGFEQYTSNWYINQLDSYTLFSPKAQKSRKYNSSNDEPKTSTDTNIQAVNGKALFDITANDTDSSFKAYYHIGMFDWLWYSNYEAYKFIDDTTCAQHPCFEYIFESEDDGRGIKSGNFNGSRFENNFKSATKKKAIKLLR